MGVKSKKARSASRKLEKQRMKAVRRAQYENYAKLGKARKRQSETTGGGEHRDCGNPACKKCFPEFHLRLASRV